jgi:hypothetical protein
VAFPYPFELETNGTAADRADGAFIACCLGLLARGLIEVAFEDDGRARGPDALWVKRGVQSQLPQPRMETVLLEALAGFQNHGGYRVARAEWAPLPLLLAAAGDALPTRRELAGASSAPFPLVDDVEYISLGMPTLFAALASAAKRLPP